MTRTLKVSQMNRLNPENIKKFTTTLTKILGAAVLLALFVFAVLHNNIP